MNVGKTKMMVSGTEGEIVLSKLVLVEYVVKGLGLTVCVGTAYEMDTWEMHENEKGNLQFC